MSEVFTASWTMLVITAVCLTSVLDSVRSETPQRSLPSLIMVVIIVSVRVIAMAWTFKKNIFLFDSPCA